MFDRRLMLNFRMCRMSSLLVLSCITLVVPAAYHSSTGKIDIPTAPAIGALLGDAAQDAITKSQNGLLFLSRGTAVVLFMVYLSYLYFQLKSHASLFEAQEEDAEEEEVSMGLSPLSSLVAVSNVI